MGGVGDLKIGIDVHGVIDANNDLFARLTCAVWSANNTTEVHVITGPKREAIEPLLEAAGIKYTHFFSIVEHHEKLGTAITYDDKGDPHIDPYLWDKTKAEYCLKHGIHLMIDDSDVYKYFFKTPYARFYSCDGARKEKMKL